MIKSPSSWSRREFITAIAGTGALVMMNPWSAWAGEEMDPRVAAIVENTLGIDTHNHVDVPLTAADAPGPRLDLAGELKRSGLSAICMTFAVDYQKLEKPSDGFDRFLAGLDAMDAQLKFNGLTRSLNLSELRAAHEKRQPTVIQSVEGGHFLDGKAERLGLAYERGLRHLGLLHDNDASVPLGDVYTNPARWGGLTAFGAEIIKECNRLGILIDLAHANAETIVAALKVTTRPVVISHTGLDSRLGKNPTMARMMRPRLISKEQAKTVADAGGAIGVWTHLAETPLDYAQNVRAMADVVGIDHVCIGTDTKLTPALRAPRNNRGPSRPADNGSDETPKRQSTDSGVREGDSGENDQPRAKSDGGKSQERVGERTNRAWQNQSTGFYYAVVDALLKTGFTPEEIGKVGGGNFCRIFGAATS